MTSVEAETFSDAFDRLQFERKWNAFRSDVLHELRILESIAKRRQDEADYMGTGSSDSSVKFTVWMGWNSC